MRIECVSSACRFGRDLAETWPRLGRDLAETWPRNHREIIEESSKNSSKNHRKIIEKSSKHHQKSSKNHQKSQRIRECSKRKSRKRSTSSRIAFAKLKKETISESLCSNDRVSEGNYSAARRAAPRRVRGRDFRDFGRSFPIDWPPSSQGQ